MDFFWGINTDDYEKCGEILTSFYMHKRLYALKCQFCTEICNTLSDFIEHIELTHSSILAKTEIENVDLTNPLLVEPKDEFPDAETEAAEDPFKKSDIEEKQVGDVSSTNNKSIKLETDNESDDVEFKDTGESEESSENDTDEDENDETPRNSFLDTEIDSNPDISLALIEGWEKLPVLWNKTSTQPNVRKKREDALRKLSKELNKKFGKRMKWTGIQERIKKFRIRYRYELVKEQRAKSKGKDHKPTWYFAKLHFLRDNIKLKRSHLEEDDKVEKLTEIPFTDEQHIQFIVMYKSFPCLWDIDNISFRSKNEREKALKDILTQVNEKMQMKLTADDIQRRLHRIRKACTKEKHEQLKCEELGITYKPNFKYYTNIDFLLENVCPFKCPYCKETFKGREPFRVHKSKHDGSSPFTCSICKKGFSSPGNLAIHLRRHNRDYIMECKPCERKFATTDEYKIHMRQHTGEKPYFCEVCGKSFATGSLFGRHKRRHENRPTHFCTICNRGFYEQIRYKEHMNIHNNVRDRVCDVCGKGFTHLKYLKQHVLIHSGRKDYICKICGKEFAQSAGLYWHMKTHGAKVSEKISTDNKYNKKMTAKQSCSSV